MIYLVLSVFFVVAVINGFALVVYFRRDFAVAGAVTSVTFLIMVVLFCGTINMLNRTAEDNYLECIGKMPADKAGYCDRYLAGEKGSGRMGHSETEV